MEFTKAQIAGLVLGYLKSEKYNDIYQAFLNESPHLEKAQEVIRSGKYFVTRVYGLSLEDIIYEYGKVYTIVHGHLEATDYFDSDNRTNSLADQVAYLLERKASGLFTSSPLDIECSSASALPGNSGGINTKNYVNHKTPRHKDDSRLHKSTEDFSTSGLTGEQGVVLAQTLLENRELHEKIAETINIVRNTPELIAPAVKNQSRHEDISSGAEKELDATIKTVIQKTEEDPIFTKLLNDIIGIGVMDQSLRSKAPDADSSLDDPKSDSGDKIEKHNRDKTETTSSRPSVESALDAITNEAVQSIMAVTNNTEESKAQKDNANSYVSASNPVSLAPQNQIYLNPGGLYMVPSTLTSNTTVTSSKQQFYLVNNPSVLNMNLQPISTTSVISEQDIMTMPTVIVNEDMTPSVILPSAHQVIQNSTVSVAEKAASADGSECITFYANADSNEKSKNRNKTSSKTKVVKPKKPEIKVEIKLEKKQPQNIAPKHSTPPEEKPAEKPKTPKSGSHIRNLDFSSPPKSKEKRNAKINSTHNSGAKKNLSKNLFREDKKSTTSSKQKDKPACGKSWDADLRAAVKLTTTQDNPVISKRKSKDDKSEVNTTMEEGLLLEAALRTPCKTDSEFKESENKKTCKNASEEKDVAELKECLVPEPEDEPIIIDNEVKLKYSLRNCNSAPKFKKKCNTSSSNKKEIMQSNVKTDKIKSDDPKSNLLLLSPTKLNASKRNIVTVETDTQSNDNIVGIEKNTEDNIDETSQKPSIIPVLETPEKYMIPKTPRVDYESVTTPFTKALEEQLTGLDLTTISTPKLPLTPNFPITPSVCLTSSVYSNRPTDYSTSSSYYQPSDSEQKSLEQILIEESERITRATKKESTVKIISDVVLEKSSVKEENLTECTKKLTERLTNFNHSVIGKKNLNLVKHDADISSSEESDSSGSEDSDSQDETWNESVSNETVITKVNDKKACSYSLRNRTSVSKNKTSKGGNKGKENEDSLKESVSKNRNVVTQKTAAEVVVKPNDSTVTEKSVEKATESILKNKSITATQKSVLLEMEEKRKRTINKFKAIDSSLPGKKNTPSVKRNIGASTQSKSTGNSKLKRGPDGKFLSAKKPRKTPPTKKTYQNEKKKIESSGTAIKDEPSTSKFMKKLDLNTEPDNTDEDFILQLSSDEDHIEPSELVETHLAEYSNSPVLQNSDFPTEKLSNKSVEKASVMTKNNIENEPTASDQEAEKLVIGLKERGIHLMHKKSPGKQQKSTEDIEDDNETFASEMFDNDNEKKILLEKVKKERMRELNITEADLKIDSKTDDLRSNIQTVEASSKNLERKISTKEDESATFNRISEDITKDMTHKHIQEEVNDEEENVEDALDVSLTSSEDIPFDVKEITHEDYYFEYSEYEKHNSLDDYDFTMLDKPVTANVYIEELDTDVARSLSITPFETLLDIPSQVNVLIPKRKSRSDSFSTKNISNSPYANRFSERIENEPTDLSLEKGIELKKVESSKVEAVAKTSIQSSKSVVKNMEIVNGKIMLNQENELEENKVEDDLMNYAAIGSVREENADSHDDYHISPKNPKKRKAQNADDDKHRDKKIKTQKCEKLLKNIDVEDFLDKVHGGDKVT